MIQLPPEKLAAFIEAMVLDKGSHLPNHTFCVMEATAYVAGEAWSDKPACVDPVLTAYCITLNDRWPTERRQALKPYIARLVGTKADRALSLRRAFMATDAAVRIFAPIALEASGFVKEAMALRLVPAIVDRASAAASYAASYAAVDAAASDQEALNLLDRMISVMS